MPTSEQLQARLRKIERIRTGEKPRVLEICSGCGGLSLALKAVGFDLAAHIEVDADAAATYKLNFGANRPVDDPWARARDMVSCSAAELVDDLSLKASPAECFDLLAAGLPCQAFARIGRSKLRAVAGGEDDAFQKDPRAALYRRFLEYVTDVQPLIIIIENVPDILNFGGHNVPEEICETLEGMGYRTAYTLLNAAYFGVPQIRERLFLVAYANAMEIEPRFPDPTHFLRLPRGYEGARRVALKHVGENGKRFRPIPTPTRGLGGAVSVREALGDLPKITEHRTNSPLIRRRKLSDPLPYRTPRAGVSDYGRLMRGWHGFATGDTSSGHLVRITPRDFPIFARMQHGGEYPHAHAIAEGMFRAELENRSICGIAHDSEEYIELRQAIVPRYDPGKFPNKWWKLHPRKPSRTLTAHMGKDTYSHIHYDSRQARTVSVREAARLQSFPDGFQFAGAMNAALRQIGNAVPPLLGLALAKSVKAQLDQLAAPRSASREAA